VPLLRPTRPDAVVVGKPGKLASRPMPDPIPRSRREGHHARSAESLAVDDEVVSAPPQIREPSHCLTRHARASPPCGQFPARKRNNTVQCGVRCHGLREGILNHPVDRCIGPSRPQAGQDGHGPADIPERAGPDHQDALWRCRGLHGGQSGGDGRKSRVFPAEPRKSWIIRPF